MSESLPRHDNRVYVRRRGRMTLGQARALGQEQDPYRVGTDELLRRSQDPALQAPVGLEIGFGMGQALVEWCRLSPDWYILGFEVYQPGIGSALLQAREQGLTNLGLLEGDAAALLQQTPAHPWLQEVRIFFPDPWPKKRHHKRRLIQSEFIGLLCDRLRPQALLRVATDWAPYAEHIHGVLQQADGLRNLGAPDGTAPRFAQRGTTRFEARGQRLGHETWDFLYQRR